MVRRFAGSFTSFVAALALGAVGFAISDARAEPTLRTPKDWSVESSISTPVPFDLYTSTWRTLRSWVVDRTLWQRNDLLVTMLHDNAYLTIMSSQLSSVAPGALLFIGPAGFGGGTMFALQIPF